MKRQTNSKEKMKDVSSTWNKTAESLREFHSFCYIVGVQTVRCFRSIVRFTRWLWRPIADGLKQLARVVLRLLTRRHHRKAFITAFNFLAPIAAIAVLLVTVNTWRNARYALTMSYGDATVGYIANEGVYTNALSMVKKAVNNVNGDFSVKKPHVQVALIGNDVLLEEQDVYDRVMTIEGDSLVSAAGLYVNGEFSGVLTETSAIKNCMAAVLEEQKSSKYDGVDFLADCDIQEGLYPASAVITETEMTARLKKIPVQMMKNVSVVEKAKYSTVYERDTSLPLGYEQVVRKGKDGKQRVNSQIIYVDGKERYRTVVSIEVLQAPIDRVIRIGSQVYSDTSIIGDGVAKGTFVWPLPYTKTISSHFANRWGRLHGAIDISNGAVMGKPIIASDGGTVLEAQFHGSYGYYVLIDHGNGFMTRYAHCSKLEVEAGQKVAQGQYIAKVGNTGYSFGAHLHFEIIENGKLVDPLKYVKR